MQDATGQDRSLPNYRKELVKLLSDLGYRHGHWQVFADFVEMSTLSISCAVDLRTRVEREQRYLEVVKRYKSDEAARFPEMLGCLVMAL